MASGPASPQKPAGLTRLFQADREAEMYLSRVTIENFRCFGEGDKGFALALKPGLTALVGENDSGKTAVIDALRFALGTTDQEWYRLEDSDFHTAGTGPGQTASEIRIVCKFENLSDADQRAFIEYLTYSPKPADPPVLYVSWAAKYAGDVRNGRLYRRVEMNSGEDGSGPAIPQDVRDLLRATYLRPLRDAAQALSAGRGSRLAQILNQDTRIRDGGKPYDPTLLKEQQIDPAALTRLSVLGIGDLANDLLHKQEGVSATRADVDAHLKKLALTVENIRSAVKVSGTTASAETRLRQLLEKLDFSLGGPGELGLGSNNLLFMACELLLLAAEAGSRLLLIEEPEAHLHAQRQLRVMDYMQKQAAERGIQIIVTTHSPNLASAIKLDNIVMIREGRGLSLAHGQTLLELSDYRFLERFLDVTKANLFFARGVMIVEGEAENILVPTLTRMVGSDFTEHGVSIVNVGGIGLRRYARIFQRKDVAKDGDLSIPVACVTDMDVMPDCAPAIVGLVDKDGDWPTGRRWKAKKDVPDLAAHRAAIDAKASGQNVRTFVSDEWTLEYDLALGPRAADGTFPGGLAEDVYVAACLAAEDDAINEGKKQRSAVAEAASAAFTALKGSAKPLDGCTAEEVLASHVYAQFVKGGVSKAIAAQYLAERLSARMKDGSLTTDDLQKRLPKYLADAIRYAAGNAPLLPDQPNQGDAARE
jgi:putative ATP-dependent endonuclease of OLD family